jgi:hypothetical protein
MITELTAIPTMAPDESEELLNTDAATGDSAI